MCVSCCFPHGKKDHSVIAFMCLNKKGDAAMASPFAIWSLKTLTLKVLSFQLSWREILRLQMLSELQRTEKQEYRRLHRESLQM